MSNEIRPGIVAEIVLCLAGDAPVAHKLHAVNALHATSAERLAAGEAMAKAAVDTLIEAGALTPVSTPTVLDMSMQQIAALAAVWAVLRQWSVTLTPGKRLGDSMKVLPADHVAQIERALLWGGFAHVDDDDETSSGGSS
jgi:hypothetical protein